MKVLVVDFDDNSRKAMVESLLYLGFEGAEVFEAVDASQAKQHMTEHPDTDLMMLDFNLPKINGYDYLVGLRLTPEHVETPLVVMVTCEDSMGSMLSALAAGANEYIMKPFDHEIVVGKLEMIGALPKRERNKEHICH